MVNTSFIIHWGISLILSFFSSAYSVWNKVTWHEKWEKYYVFKTKNLEDWWNITGEMRLLIHAWNRGVRNCLFIWSNLDGFCFLWILASHVVNAEKHKTATDDKRRQEIRWQQEQISSWNRKTIIQLSSPTLPSHIRNVSDTRTCHCKILKENQKIYWIEILVWYERNDALQANFSSIFIYEFRFQQTVIL